MINATETNSDLYGARLWTVLLIVLVLCMVVALRLRCFQKQTGLNRDEAALAINIVGRDAGALLKPLGGDQSAPIGHILLSKGMTHYLGNTETAMRLPALVASILMLVLFVALSRQILDPFGQVLGLALLGLSWPLLEFAVNVKQYSGDGLATVALLIAGFWAQRQSTGLGRFFLLGATGIVALGFSQPAIFVLGGIGLTLIAGAVAAGRPREALGWSAVAALWAALFLALYALVYRHYASSSSLLDHWDKEFAPFPPRSLSEVKWYYDHFFGLFIYPMGVKFDGLAGACFLFGAYLLMKQCGPRTLGMLIAPLILTLVASAIRRYPFEGRLLFFACPIFAALIAAGGAGIGDAPQAGGRVLRGLVATLLLIFPGYMSLKDTESGIPVTQGDIKPALAYVAAHWRDGDVIYLNFGAITLTDFYINYLNYKNLKGTSCVFGIEVDHNASMEHQYSAYAGDLEKVGGKPRVWILFAMSQTAMEPIFTYLLDRRGSRLDAFHGQGSAALLYDLSGPAPAQTARGLATSISGQTPSTAPANTSSRPTFRAGASSRQRRS
jgi:hypothetical protein